MTHTDVVDARRTALPIVGGAVGWVKQNGLIAPALVFAIVVTQAPFLLTIWFSLQKWNLLRPENSRFNGIGNYLDLFQTSDFISALINTVTLVTTAVLISLLLGLLFAELFNSRFFG